MGKCKYMLLTNTTYFDYTGAGPVELAKVIDDTTGEDILFVIYQKNLFREYHYHLSIGEFSSNEGLKLAVVLDDLHRDCLYKQPKIFLAIILHELGHHINGDNHNSRSSDEIRNERLQYILAGKVQDYELKADAFAVEHVGKNTFIRSLDYLIDKRKLRGDSGMELAVKELELRKKAIQKIK